MASLDTPKYGWEGISNGGEIWGGSSSSDKDKDYEDDKDYELPTITRIRQMLDEEDEQDTEIEEEDYRKLIAEMRERIEERRQDSKKEEVEVSKELEDSIKMLKEHRRDFDSALDEILYDGDVEEMKRDAIENIIAMTDLNELDDESLSTVREELGDYSLTKLNAMEKQLGAPQQVDSPSKKI